MKNILYIAGADDASGASPKSPKSDNAGTTAPPVNNLQALLDAANKTITGLQSQVANLLKDKAAFKPAAECLDELLKILGLGEKARPEDILDAVESLHAKVDQLTIEKTARTEDEKTITEKMSKGLTRAQAVKIVERQKAYDASDINKARTKAINDAKAGKRKPAGVIS